MKLMDGAVDGSDEQSVIQVMPTATCRVDSEWRYLFVNRAYAKLARLEEREMVGRVLWDVFPAILGTRFEAAGRQVMDDRVPVQFDVLFEPHDAW